MATFERAGLVLSYDDLGGPADRTVVFLHGLLLSAGMMRPIAQQFAGEFRPVLLELHGHGRSSRPTDLSVYSMEAFALDVVGLLDHLGVERAGVFGTSLGADVGVELMLVNPERAVGAVLEMPVLERGARIARRMFRPVAALLRTRRAPQALAFVARRFPEMKFYPGFNEALTVLAENPISGAAVIEGLLASAASPERWAEVNRCPVPALVIGHPRDPLHAFGDADELARRLPNGRLVRARNMLELRLRPARLLAIAKHFLAGCFNAAQEKSDEERTG